MRLRRRSPVLRRPRRTPAWVRAAGWLCLLLGALLVVTWRQTRGLQLEEGLRTLETQREILEADRMSHLRQIRELQSRARVVRVARERLGMRLAVGDEIVFLPATAATPSVPASETVIAGVER